MDFVYWNSSKVFIYNKEQVQCSVTHTQTSIPRQSFIINSSPDGVPEEVGLPSPISSS